MMLKQMVAAIRAALAVHAFRSGFAPAALALSLDKEAHGKLPKDVQPLYVEKEGKFVLDLPDGVEEVKGLKSSLQKERDRADKEEKARKDLEKRFEGLDVDQIREMMKQFENAEEAELLKQGKEGIKKLVEKQMVREREGWQRERAQLQKKIDDATGHNKKLSMRALDERVRAAATKAGLHAHAVEDALFRARSIFVVGDDGEVVQLGDDNKPIMGKDGKTPYGPSEWLESMKETAPHWFPNLNSGGGATGDKGKGGERTMKRSEFEKLSPADRQKTVVTDKVVIVD